MKNFGRYLLKNNIHIMTLIFIGFAIWAALNWANLLLIQKLVMGLYFLIILHEYEEVHTGFMELFTGALGVSIDRVRPGMLHIAPAVYITVAYAAALLVPELLWLSFGVFVLALFEGFIHTMGIFLFRLGKPSPGWYTAILMCGFVIWSIVTLNANVEYEGVQWLYGVLCFFVCFLTMEFFVQRILGNRLRDMPRLMLGAFRRIHAKK